MKTTEQLAVNLFDKMFDRDLHTRMKALSNEYKELQESFEKFANRPNPLNKEEFINELADVQSVITHITNIVNSSFEEQLLYTNKKLLSRIEISKYRGKDYIRK